MESTATAVDSLLEGEILQASNSDTLGDDRNPGPAARLNAVWRQKVVGWYFTVVAALRVRHSHSTAVDSSSGSIVSPSNRASVHVAVSLLDNYLMSLPSERALRYQHDRAAYQLLATTCLLLGLRLAQLDRSEATNANERAATDPRPLKRAKTHRTNMHEAPAVAAARMAPADVAIPNASALLRLVDAPASISERRVASLAREMTGSPSFPRGKVVTALHFVAALRGARTRVAEDGSSLSLGPADAEVAVRLADASLGESTFLGLRPSVLACAVVTLALGRSISINLQLPSIRQKVYKSIFGTEYDSHLQFLARKTESNLLGFIHVDALASRNRLSTTHLIPMEDES